MKLRATMMNSTWSDTLVASQSGAEATAVQTLRDCPTSPKRAKRLDCGAFTAAFEGASSVLIPPNFP